MPNFLVLNHLLIYHSFKKVIVMRCLTLILFLSSQLIASGIDLTLQECLFVKYPVPDRGIVSSNPERAERLASHLDHSVAHKNSWGSTVIIGEYKGTPMFVACAPVGTGAGLLFTELYVAGAQYILRLGSDDARNLPESEYHLVKIVDEADNLYGFEMQSGMDLNACGNSIWASPKMVGALVEYAALQGFHHELRVCHHLENYHALRYAHLYPQERQERLKQMLVKLEEKTKPASFDMETAVLFRVANDFGRHAATVLVTVKKDDPKLSSYEGELLKKAREIEETLFFPYVLETMKRLD